MRPRSSFPVHRLVCSLVATAWIASCAAGSLDPISVEAGASTRPSGAPTHDAGNASSAGDPGTAASPKTGSSTTASSSSSANSPTTFNKAFFMGVLPDYDNPATQGLAGFIQRVNTTPAASSGYVNVGPDGTIETATGLRYIDEARANNVPLVSLSLTARQKGALSDAQLAGIQALIAEAQKQNMRLNLRYGYEMNYGGGGDQYQNINNNNDPSDFLSQWAQVAAVANPYRASTPAVKMVWSPNIKSGGTLPYSDWEPKDPSTIDVVGVDWYYTPGNAMDTDSVYASLQDIYAIAAQLKIPFILGETGVITKEESQSESDQKYAWLKALCAPALLAKMPYYQGFYWFDYIKGGVRFAISQDSYAAPSFAAWYAAMFATANG